MCVRMTLDIGQGFQDDAIRGDLDASDVSAVVGVLNLASGLLLRRFFEDRRHRDGTDTIVQLFCFQASGVIASSQPIQSDMRNNKILRKESTMTQVGQARESRGNIDVALNVV